MRRTTIWRWCGIFVLIAGASFAFAQDAREALGPKDNPTAARGPHPLTLSMKSLHSELRPELRGRHPRVFVTDAELQQLRERARTTHRDLWQAALKKVRALQHDPPPPPAEARRAQNDVGIGIVEAALAYKIEGDARYLAAAKKYMDAAVSYAVWGYSFNKPNIDLAAGHLLYGFGAGYDLLYNDLTPAERTCYRDKLARQAQILADAYEPKPGRTYSYSQTTSSFLLPDSASPRTRSTTKFLRRRTGLRWRAPSTIAPSPPIPPTAIITKASSIGCSPRRGSFITSTRKSTLPAKTCLTSPVCAT